MPRFSYQAYTQDKEKKEGVIEAETKTQAFEKLSKLSFYPLQIKALDEAGEGALLTRRFTRISAADIVAFTRQLSNLLEAGMTILSALLLVSKQAWKASLKAVIDGLINDLKEGRTFSLALSKHPGLFSKVYVALVKSSEAGGFMNEAMTRLADFMEEEEEFKAKVRSAMIYPAVIALVGAATVYVLLSFVIPKLVLVFEDFGQILPLPTQLLVTVSIFLGTYWWLTIIAILAVAFMWMRILKSPDGRSFVDRVKLNIPVFGELILKIQMERFSRILATLLASGVTILPALEIVRDTLDNALLQKDLEEIRVAVRDGASLSVAVGKSHYFPAAIVDIISVGEESGNLEKVLLKVAQTYTRETDRTLKTFLSLLEPAMILVMGSIVAFIVIAMLLPIFQINFMAR